MDGAPGAGIIASCNWTANAAGCLLLAGWDDRQADEGGVLGRVPDALRSPVKIRCLGGEDVRHKRLRVAVVEREERGLHLHHDAMTRLECVVNHRQRKDV